MAKASPQPVPLIPLIAGLMVFIIAFHLGSAATGREFVRATHLGTALEYAQGRIDLLHPTIVGFNATGTPTAQELPLWQALTAAVFKMTGSTWYGWGNVVSLLLFSTGLWPFMQLGRWYVGERAARWGLLFSFFQLSSSGWRAKPPPTVFASSRASGSVFAERFLRRGLAW